MKQHLQITLDHEPLVWINGVVYSNRPAWYNVTARALHMDLIVPKERPHHAPQPAVLFLCGGAYMVMDRSIWLPELMTLARAGYTVASMEYRTSNEAAFPAALEDVKTAVRFLRAHAEEYCVDPARIFLMGESAGGTLACLGGVTAGIAEFDRGDWPEQSSAVQGVVDFYGLTDLEHAPCVTGPGALADWTVPAFLGAYAPAGAAARASAIRYISRSAPPFFIVHGSADPLVPIAQSERFYEALMRNGVDAEYYILDGGSHGTGEFYQSNIMDRVTAFLDRISRGE